MACSQQEPSPQNANCSWEKGRFGLFFPLLYSLSLYDHSFSGRWPWSFKTCLKLHAWISEQLRIGQSASKFNVQDVLTAQSVTQGTSREKPNEGSGQLWSLARQPQKQPRSHRGDGAGQGTGSFVTGHAVLPWEWDHWLRSTAHLLKTSPSI